jgi:hypothetical protein
MRYIAVIVLLLTGCTFGENWTRGDTYREVAWGAIHAVDWAQTRQIAQNPEYHETNPILGSHPSVGSVDLYMASALVIHPVISAVLPKPYRDVWQYLSIGVSGACVINNVSIGVGF